MSAHPEIRCFTNPGAYKHVIPLVSSFDQVVETLNLSPSQYEGSAQLREWVVRNKDHKYVPTEVLNAFGFEVE
jgi:hypothetical protein